MTRSTESGRIMLIRKEFAEDGVLIELYWNVNEVAFVHALDTEAVLIELYWNVNMRLFCAAFVAMSGINRTILECKLTLLRRLFFLLHRY